MTIKSFIARGWHRPFCAYTNLTAWLWSVENLKGGQAEGTAMSNSWVVGGLRREGQEAVTPVVISVPVTSGDGWVWGVRRKGIYLKMAIKQICLSRGKMAVQALTVDVSDEARLIHLQTDTAALMWLKIADLPAGDGAAVESASSPVGLWM